MPNARATQRRTVHPRKACIDRLAEHQRCLPKGPQDLPLPDLLNEVQEDRERFLTKPMLWLGKRMLKIRNRSSDWMDGNG